ncbi:MAG: hypothetical protein KF722_12025 [Nitrospira sp.]|nr:hypothetical protein [Nitrospira sp.]
MSTAWWIKASPRRKGSIGKRKFRWDLLGLQDPAVTASTPSIEDVRRQIKSAASYGLSAETLLRSREKDGQPKPRSKVSETSRKRGTAQ